MKLQQQSNSYAIFNGWYGGCDEDCAEFDLNAVGDDLYAVYEFESSGVGSATFMSNGPEHFNRFTKLICGKSYLIVLRPGSNYVEIPSFISTSFQDGAIGFISKDCKTDQENVAPTKEEIKDDTDLSMQRSWNQGTYTYSVDVKMPTSSNEKYPVAILLHGAGGNGSQMTQEFANDLPNHILLGVSGYENSWNIANETSNGPDIQMLVDLINRLKDFENVDETKIRLIGVSNGGALALRAAVEITDSALDVVACFISQTNTDQYRNNNFYFPSNHEQTGNLYSNFQSKSLHCGFFDRVSLNKTLCRSSVRLDDLTF